MLHYNHKVNVIDNEYLLKMLSFKFFIGNGDLLFNTGPCIVDRCMSMNILINKNISAAIDLFHVNKDVW